MGSKLKLAGALAVGVVAGALATTQLQAIAQGVPHLQLRQFADVFALIKTDYVEPVSDSKLIDNAISGMVSGLDPHSQYFDAKSFKEFREATQGRFVGVGIEISMEDGLVKVVSPIEGSPAFKAGLKPGDLITRIDDTVVKGLTLDQAVKRMRGEPKTRVALSIYRKSENRSFTVTVVRDTIRVQSVRGRIVQPGYAWIRISQFQDQTVADFTRKAQELVQQSPGLKGLVLDLRNDPGGLLDGAVAISAAFLPPKSVVVTTNGQIAESKASYAADPKDYAGRGPDPLAGIPEVLKTVPVVVLVNEGTASASEIVSGALQDYKRATIMGSQTFGKGSVQTVRQLSADTAVKFTTALYYTPKGRSIQAQGIIPDVKVDDSLEGSQFAALRLREADLDKHLQGKNEVVDPAREAAREAARKKLEAQMESGAKPPEPPPEYGSDKDFQLQQALNFLQGKPVVTSKTQVERPPQKKDDDGATPAPDAKKPAAPPAAAPATKP
ncbi:S41 family peptidase [Amphibiibacter pelophylacis]|uniref:S41 family peptidase n=1 Tax=Amphibiibacter pelophylacis TaxID=1799477 RepID=A0ACC6P1I6_9BURK